MPIFVLDPPILTISISADRALEGVESQANPLTVNLGTQWKTEVELLVCAAGYATVSLTPVHLSNSFSVYKVY